MVELIKGEPGESRKEWLLDRFACVGKSNPKVRDFKFWIDGSHPIEQFPYGTMLQEKLDYIHQNPVKELIVFRAEDYLFSSACDYAGEKGMLKVILIN